MAASVKGRRPDSRWLLAVGLSALIAACVLELPNHPSIAFDAQRADVGWRVTGTTDLPDGAILTVSAWESCVDPGDPGFPDDVAEDWQEVLVADGAFEAVLALAVRVGEPVSTWVSFDPGPDQPGAAIDAYGKAGEKLRGPGVVDDSGVRRYVLVTCTEGALQ